MVGTTPPKSLSWRTRQKKLRQLAARINRHPQQHAAHTVLLGKLLQEAKALAGHGRFTKWLETHTPKLRVKQARRLMSLSRRLGAVADLQLFLPSAALALKPRVLKNKTLMAELTEAAKASLAKQKKRLGYQGVLLVVAGIQPDEIVEQPDETPEETALRHLEGILSHEQVTSLHITPDRDPDDPSVQVTVLGEGVYRTAMRRDLPGALAALAGEEQVRRCPKCGITKLLPQFSKQAKYCKTCERARVKDYTARTSGKPSPDAPATELPA